MRDADLRTNGLDPKLSEAATPRSSKFHGRRVRLGRWNDHFCHCQSQKILIFLQADHISSLQLSTNLNVPEVIAGYCQHLLYLSPGDVIEALKWNYLATPPLLFSPAASKISICLFLLCALAQTRVRFRRSFPYGIIILLTGEWRAIRR